MLTVEGFNLLKQVEALSLEIDDSLCEKQALFVNRSFLNKKVKLNTGGDSDVSSTELNVRVSGHPAPQRDGD
jgi:hypothetical protein